MLWRALRIAEQALVRPRAGTERSGTELSRLSCQGQTINISGFVGNAASVTTVHLCRCIS